MTVTAIIATYDGSPAPDQAHRLIWEASSILAGRVPVRWAEQTKMLSGAWLLRLTYHDNHRVAREARKACMRFGINSTPIAPGFTLDRGDSA